jgi:hypothetical protein
MVNANSHPNVAAVPISSADPNYKFCKDCAFYAGPAYSPSCKAEGSHTVDLVTGKIMTKSTSAYHQRDPKLGKCGIDAKLFVQKVKKERAKRVNYSEK